MSVGFARFAVPRLTTDMLRVSADSRSAKLALLVLCALVIDAPVLAASDVADAVMQQDAARLERIAGKIRRRQRRSGRRHDRPALGRLPRRSATVKRLLAAGANPAAHTDTGITPLTLACEAGSAEVVKLLLDAGADANQTLSHGETPLMMAARTGSVGVMQELLAHGAKVDARESLRGTTPLMWAAANRNTEAVRLLISKGADINAHSGTVRPGRMPYLADPSRDRIQEFIDGRGQGGTVVKDERPDGEQRLATEREKAKAALARFPFSIPVARRGAKQFGGLTPLIFATKQGDLETVKVLLKAGANVNETSEYGWTALLDATQNRFYQLGAYLLEHGADPNIANEGGWTRSTSPPTTVTSKAAIIRPANRTWTTWSSSSGCSLPGPRQIFACVPAPRRAQYSPTNGSTRRARRHFCALRSQAIWFS